MRIHWATDGTNLWSYVAATMVRRAAASLDQRQRIDGDLLGTISTYLNGDNRDSFVFNFPHPLTLAKIGLKAPDSLTGGNAFSIQISSDSTDGMDGTWTTLASNQTYSAGTYTTYSVTPTACSWLRIHHPSSYFQPYALHLFGDYATSPPFEIWDAAGSAKVTADYLDFGTCLNTVNNNKTVGFQIKNTSGATKSFTATVTAIHYGGDVLSGGAVTLSTDGGNTKNSAVTISNLADNTLSGVITFCLDLPASSNPADGIHYIAADVTYT